MGRCKPLQNRWFTMVLFCLGFVSIVLSGCSGKDKESVEPADVLVEKAMEDFNHGDYYNARDTFKKIKDNYPFSSQSLLAELKIADCYYYISEYDDALTHYEEFEKNHPTHQAIAYVMFQIGMSHFKRIDTEDRDTSGASKSIQAFMRLLKTFPQSPYVEEARIRISKAKDFLADHEFYVANFYARTKEYGQAERRINYIIDTYPDSAAAEKARKLLLEVREKRAAKERKNGGRSDDK